jgi:Holliday junction resolvasome RuvABC endonuclease subunit
MKIILGIDCGFTHMGMVFVNPYNMELIDALVMVTKKEKRRVNVRVSDDDSERMKYIVRGMDEIIKRYDGNDIFAVLEAPSGGSKSARANRAMGISSAIPITICTLLEIPFEIITPREVKDAMTNDPNASKEKMMRTALDKFPDVKYFMKPKHRFEHICDALGAVMHVKRNSELFKVFVKS